MPNPAIGLIGASVGSSAISAKAQSSAAKDAANAQTSADQAGIAEQRRQFDKVQELLSPYVDAGDVGLQGVMDLIGGNGAGAQQGAIEAIQNGPEYGILVDQGEEAILANASATGGLRGGDVQAALGQFRPQVLSGLIDKQYGRFGGLATSGQNAAAGLGGAAQSMGNNVTQLLGQSGAARAGASLARGEAISGFTGSVNQGLGFGFGRAMAPAGSPGGLPEGATLFGKWGF